VTPSLLWSYQIIEATHPTVHRPTEEFEYDAVGNRTGGSKTHNELNQLTEDDSCRYSYDLDGNMTLKVSKATSDSTKYTWNIENRLVKVEMPNGTVVEYVYGPLGRRLAKIVNGVRKEYRYDGENLIIEMDSQDSIISSYTFGPGIDQPLAMHRNNKDYYYLADGLGSVTAITNENGNVLQEYWYAVFGEVLAQSADSVVNPFTYTAREEERETGLMYYRNRFYDPGMGRFLSEDPISFMGMDVNLYRYVWNSSPNFVDPSGLVPPKMLPGKKKENLKIIINVMTNEAFTNSELDVVITAVVDATGLGDVGTALGLAGKQISADNTITITKKEDKFLDEILEITKDKNDNDQTLVDLIEKLKEKKKKAIEAGTCKVK
jgi:RHS repeat-associated protein